MREPVWPSVQSIVEFNQEVVAGTGEQTIVDRTDDLFPDRFRRFVNGPTLFDSEA